MEFIIPGFVLLVLAWVAYLYYVIEPREFNKGVCRCGNLLRHFDTDSGGGRGWTCDSCRREMWINGPADKWYINPRITSVDYLHYPTYVANRDGYKLKRG
jgi:hypothetical protein